MLNSYRWIVQGTRSPIQVAEVITADKWTNSAARVVPRRYPVRLLTRGVGKSDDQVTTYYGWGEVGTYNSFPHLRPTVHHDYEVGAAGVEDPIKWVDVSGRVTRRLISGIGRLYIDPYILTQPEYSSIDKWLGHRGRIVRPLLKGRTDSTIDSYQLTLPEVTTVDRYTDFRVTKRSATPRQPLRPLFSIDAYQLTQPEYISIDRFGPSYAAGRPARQPLRPRFDIDAFHLLDAEIAVPGSWLNAYRTFSPTAKQPVRIYNSIDLKLLELTLSQWESSTSIGRTYRQPVRPRYDIDSYALMQPEATSVDKWLWSVGKASPAPRHPTRPRFDIDSYLMTLPEFSSFDKWASSTGQRMRAASQPMRSYIPADTNPEEIVTLDKFLPNYPEFARRRKVRGFHAFDIDAKQLTLPEASTMDKWWSDHLVLPWRAIDKFQTRRSWMAYPIRIVISLPDVIRSSTKAVVQAKSTEPVVMNKTTKAVITAKLVGTQVVKTTKPVTGNKTTFKP